jgi:hypothetical protein
MKIKERFTGFVGRVRNRVAVVAVTAVTAVVGSSAFAEPTSPTFDLSAVATGGIASIQGLITDALPFIAFAIGAGILLSWAKRVFRF